MRHLIVLLLAVVCTSAPLVANAGESPAPRQRYLDVGGAKIYVETLGTGPPIVFLHGGIRFFATNFERQRDYFASFRTVVGIDRRGHGHSPDTAQPFSYEQMAEETAAVIEQLDLGPVDVVGHSDGGNVGLLLARDHPRLVRRLVVAGANLRSSLPAEELKRRREWKPDEIAAKARELASQMPPAFRTEFERVAPGGPEQWWTLVTKSYQLWLTPVVIAPADLKSIRVPVLVIAGDHDFTPLEETIEIYRNLPKGQLLILPDTGHGTMTQRPELVNSAMRAFFESAER